MLLLHGALAACALVRVCYWQLVVYPIALALSLFPGLCSADCLLNGIQVVYSVVVRWLQLPHLHSLPCCIVLHAMAHGGIGCQHILQSLLDVVPHCWARRV